MDVAHPLYSIWYLLRGAAPRWSTYIDDSYTNISVVLNVKNRPALRYDLVDNLILKSVV